jgi:hypothetical protein
MEFDKNQILDMLKGAGQHDDAKKADQELPDKVDTDQHSDLLQKFGVNPQDLIGKLGGMFGK